MRNSSNVKTIALLLAMGVLFGCGTDDLTVGESPPIRYIVLQHDALPSTGNAWHSCIPDTQSGLTWELKTNQAGLHDWVKM